MGNKQNLEFHINNVKETAFAASQVTEAYRHRINKENNQRILITLLIIVTLIIICSCLAGLVLAILRNQ